jgi:hypothetical protein
VAFRLLGSGAAHQRPNFPEARCTGTYGVCDVGRGKMPVMPFDHPCVGVPQILGNDQKGYTVHRGETCPSVAQGMKVNRRVDFSASACLGDRPHLMTLAPCRTFDFEEHWLASRSVKANLHEEGRTVVRQNDMAHVRSRLNRRIDPS